MKKYAAITSMNKEYYDRCGKVMLETFKDKWGHLMKLYVYNEDNFDLGDKFFKPMGWDLGNEYEAFQERHKNNRVKTFSKKGFSIIHAMDNIDCDRLIWIDADVIFKSPIPPNILDDITNDKILSTHFMVWHHIEGIDYYSCETGFFVLNKRHKGFEVFKNTYKDIYYNDKTDGLRRFYDGEIYGKTVRTCSGFRMMNLSVRDKIKTPIKKSILEPYLEHHKAGMKERVKKAKTIASTPLFE